MLCCRFPCYVLYGLQSMTLFSLVCNFLRTMVLVSVCMAEGQFTQRLVVW